VYVVVTDGDAFGFPMFGLLSPVTGTQLYVTAPLAFIINESCKQTVVSTPAFNTGNENTVTVVVSVPIHPFASVTTT